MFTTHTANRLRLARILHRHMRRNGIAIAGDIYLHSGHWHVRQGQLWIRTTDALTMRLLP